MDVSTKEEFLSALHKARENFDLKDAHYHVMDIKCALESEFIKVINEKFERIDFSDINITGIEFINCTFINCYFSDSVFFACLFDSCTIQDSTFTTQKIFESEFVSTIIENCKLSLVYFADCTFKSLSFSNCFEMLDVYWGNCNFESTSFNNSTVTYSRFESSYHQEKPQIQFINCLLTRNYFSHLDFSEIKFKQGCQINLNVFQNSKVLNETFDTTVNSTGHEYNSIDFSTINKSHKINEIILRRLFGILNPEIKEYVHGLTNEIRFQSVFISYSFKDKIIAKKLNASLIEKGILTFLWEKDAPGGKGLKRIMRENVEKYDRILFIASKDSLKSEACQFELSEGRRKQEKLWEEIYFPIHIDNYLFEVNKEDIRPIKNQEEYWENILELRRLNSIDFMEFVGDFDRNRYDEKLYYLVRDLKK